MGAFSEKPKLIVLSCILAVSLATNYFFFREIQSFSFFEEKTKEALGAQLIGTIMALESCIANDRLSNYCGKNLVDIQLLQSHVNVYLSRGGKERVKTNSLLNTARGIQMFLEKVAVYEKEKKPFQSPFCQSIMIENDEDIVEMIRKFLEVFNVTLRGSAPPDPIVVWDQTIKSWNITEAFQLYRC